MPSIQRWIRRITRSLDQCTRIPIARTDFDMDARLRRRIHLLRVRPSFSDGLGKGSHCHMVRPTTRPPLMHIYTCIYIARCCSSSCGSPAPGRRGSTSRIRAILFLKQGLESSSFSFSPCQRASSLMLCMYHTRKAPRMIDPHLMYVAFFSLAPPGGTKQGWMQRADPDL